jgi:translation initiation factor 2 alpha subunit (eIF-2alpha)
MEIEEGDLLLCTVEKIVGTVVFVKIDGTNPEREGSIIVSEVAPGKIRNLRNFVVPKKKIVCKVLRISNSGNIDLSLRRVTQKEDKEIREEHEKERGYISILRRVLGEKSEEIIKKITQKERLSEFILEAKDNPKKLEEIIGKEESSKIITILKSQKQKKFKIKKEFLLSTNLPNGITLIKNILSSVKDAEITYLSAGKYSIKLEDSEIKKADNKLKEILDKIKSLAEKEKVNFEIKGKTKN